MGLCLSCRRGESHPKSSLLPPLHWKSLTTTISTDSPKQRSPYIPQTTTPVDDACPLTNIPHSSELFSLPSSNAGSIARSSTSSSSSSASASLPRPFHTMSNPKPNKMMHPRWSTNAARRKSCSALGQDEDLSELWNTQSLADTIARLEKFCDVKFFLENRRGRTSTNTSEPTTTSMAMATTASIRVKESCRDFAEKLLWLANDHAGGLFSRRDAVETKLELVVNAKQTEEEETAPVDVSSLGDAEDLRSNATKLRDAENIQSQQAFLRDAENLESNVDAAETPSMSRLPSLRFYDGEETIQFTDFEATFELLPAETSALHWRFEPEQPSSAASYCSFEAEQFSRAESFRSVDAEAQPSGSMHCSFESEAQPSSASSDRSFEAEQLSSAVSHGSFESEQHSRASISGETVTLGLGVCQSAHRRSRTSADLGGGWQFNVEF